MKDDVRVLSLRMDPALYREMQRLSEEDGCSVSAMVRKACMRYAERRKRNKDRE